MKMYDFFVVVVRYCICYASIVMSTACTISQIEQEATMTNARVALNTQQKKIRLSIDSLMRARVQSIFHMKWVKLGH